MRCPSHLLFKTQKKMKLTLHHHLAQLHSTLLYRSLTFLLFFQLLGLSSCQYEYKIDERLLTVSIEPLRYITEAIAGDCYTITTLTPEGVSPESYMPTPQQFAKMNDGSAYIYIGSLGFEMQNISKIIENCPHLYVVDVSSNIPAITHQHSCDASDSADPHIWTSPENIKIIARNICKALVHMDSTNTLIYKENLVKFNHHIDSIDYAIRHQLKDLKHRTFLINHPALAYFAKQYKLHQLSIEHEGKEGSAERVAQLIEQCKKDSVKTVFIQKQNSGRAAQRIAEEIGAKTVTINPLNYRWDEEILNIANSLSR